MLLRGSGTRRRLLRPSCRPGARTSRVCCSAWFGLGHRAREPSQPHRRQIRFRPVDKPDLNPRGQHHHFLVVLRFGADGVLQACLLDGGDECVARQPFPYDLRLNLQLAPTLGAAGRGAEPIQVDKAQLATRPGKVKLDVPVLPDHGTALASGCTARRLRLAKDRLKADLG